jgi:hypothetical protein
VAFIFPVRRLENPVKKVSSGTWFRCE